MGRLTVGSLFAGIGGLDLGLERAGMEVRWQVEIDDWCRQVLERHWPDVPRYGDIRTIDPDRFEPVDVIAGGFPCQPVSLAGRREVQDDPRWLWPAFFRVVRSLRPRYVLVENVPGLASAGMGDVLGDLAQVGYDTEWQSIPAAAVGAPHLRWRIFIVAHSGGERRQQNTRGAHGDESQDEGRATLQADVAASDGERRGTGHVADPDGGRASRRNGRPRVFRPGGRRQSSHGGQWAAEPDVGRVAHGVPRRLDRLRGLGNAVVPQVAEWVGRQIVAHDQHPLEAFQ